MRKTFEERRNLVVEMLNKAPGINCHKPEGAVLRHPAIHGCIGKKTMCVAARRSTPTKISSLRCWRRPAWFLMVHGSKRHRGISASPTPMRPEELRDACERIQHRGQGLHYAGIRRTAAHRLPPRRDDDPRVELRAQGVGYHPAHHRRAGLRQSAPADRCGAIGGIARRDEIYPGPCRMPALKQAVQRGARATMGWIRAGRDLRHQRRQAGDLQFADGDGELGDEVVVLAVSAYMLMTALFGGEPVFVDVSAETTASKPRAEDIDAAITLEDQNGWC